MQDNQQPANSLTRREAINIGLGTLLGSAVAVTGTRAEDGKAAADTTEQERLAISFWNFGLLSTGPNSIFNALEMHMAETVQRGFNCIRTECGTGITMTPRAGRAGNWSSTQSSRATIISSANCSI